MTNEASHFYKNEDSFNFDNFYSSHLKNCIGLYDTFYEVIAIILSVFACKLFKVCYCTVVKITSFSKKRKNSQLFSHT